MQRRVICAAAPSGGVRHRIRTLSSVKQFADSNGYRVSMLWGVTSGVSFCRFDELFAPIPGIAVTNVAAHQLGKLMQTVRSNNYIKIGGNHYKVFRPGETPNEDIFCWDLRYSAALARCASTSTSQIVVNPSPQLRGQATSFVQRNKVAHRLGIRVRVEENIDKGRKPRRVTRELDAVIKSIARIPWYVHVFVASDSEYIQQMVASHFADTVYLPKEFDLQEKTGRYVYRQDKNAMFTFVKEVECLCQCKKIINIGGFLNDHTIRGKITSEPYTEVAQMHLRRR